MDGGLRKLFRKQLPELALSSIESGATDPGIPDSAYCAGWVEFKAVDHWAVPLRPEQVAWMNRHARAGGRAFVAVRRARDELWLIEGRHAGWLRAKGLKEVPFVGIFSGGVSLWPWSMIKNILLSKPLK